MSQMESIYRLPYSETHYNLLTGVAYAEFETRRIDVQLGKQTISVPAYYDCSNFTRFFAHWAANYNTNWMMDVTTVHALNRVYRRAGNVFSIYVNRDRTYIYEYDEGNLRVFRIQDEVVTLLHDGSIESFDFGPGRSYSCFEDFVRTHKWHWMANMDRRASFFGGTLYYNIETGVAYVEYEFSSSWWRTDVQLGGQVIEIPVLL